MKWLIEIIDEFWQEKGSSFFRRAFMSLVCGAGLVFLILMARRSKFPAPMKQCIYYSIGAGVMAMLVTGMLEFSGLFWKKGCLGKLVACFLVFISVAGMITLIGLVISRFSPR